MSVKQLEEHVNGMLEVSQNVQKHIYAVDESKIIEKLKNSDSHGIEKQRPVEYLSKIKIETVQDFAYNQCNREAIDFGLVMHGGITDEKIRKVLDKWAGIEQHPSNEANPKKSVVDYGMGW